MSDADEEGKRGVLFICLGNICRSPVAEAVFHDLVKKKGLLDKYFIDSAATCGFHVGSKMYHKARETLVHDGNKYLDHRAREVSTADFKRFDFILGMDDSNMRDLRELQRLAKPEGKAELFKLSDFDTKKVSCVPDPYYDSDPQAFIHVLEQCKRCCARFLEHIEQK